MILLDNYIDESGDIDLDAYHKAQELVGEKCYKCKTLIYPSFGKKILCYDCQNLKNQQGSVSHESYIRCPYCEEVFEPQEHEMYNVLTDSDHDIHCPLCDNPSFTVITTVSYTFESPEIQHED